MRPGATWLVALAFVIGSWVVPFDSRADTAQPSTPLEELLEEAIFTEETVGDLEAAIKIYRQIVEQAEAERPYLAQAQFRLGMCYAKQGKSEEAADALRRLVTDFPKQEDLVGQARARLTELGRPLPGPGIAMRQVWAGQGNVSLGRVSPDGRYMTFVEWNGGGADLMLHDFASGSNRELTRRPVTSWSFAEWSVVSHDGERIAYNWFNDDGNYDLRLVGPDGSKPRILFADKDVLWLMPVDWSPDGKQVLAVLDHRNRGRQSVLIDVESAGVRVLEKLAGEAGAFSPDGRHIAFSRQQEDNGRNEDLFVFELADGQERPLVQHPANDRLLGWTPDGRYILFVSDRTGDWGVWAVRFGSGAPSGLPTLVKSDLGDTSVSGEVEPMGFTDEGSYYFGLYTKMSDVYSATFDSEAGTLSAPKKVTQRFEGSNAGPEWSSDGKKIAFVSKRDSSWFIVTRTVDTGEERDLPIPDLAYIGSGQHLRWSPDGRSFLVIGQEGDWRFGVFKIDSASGAATALAWADPGGGIVQPQWSPDGKAVFFQRLCCAGGGGTPSHITRLDLETGTETAVYREQVGAMVVSPDGRWVAFTDSEKQESTVQIVPVAGGEPRVLFRSTETPPFNRATPLAWTPDGQHLILGRDAKATHENAAAPAELWAIPTGEGEPRKLGTSPIPVRQPRVHPDGRQLVFRSETKKVDVWVMENFLAELQSNR